MKKEKTELDLKIYDVWEAPSGNLFLKISHEFSLPLGAFGGQLFVSESYSPVRASKVIPVKKVGKLKWKKEFLKNRLLNEKSEA